MLQYSQRTTLYREERIYHREPSPEPVVLFGPIVIQERRPLLNAERDDRSWIKVYIALAVS